MSPPCLSPLVFRWAKGPNAKHWCVLRLVRPSTWCRIRRPFVVIRPRGGREDTQTAADANLRRPATDAEMLAVAHELVQRRYPNSGDRCFDNDVLLAELDRYVAAVGGRMEPVEATCSGRTVKHAGALLSRHVGAERDSGNR